MEKINLLFSIDDNFTMPFMTVLRSIELNHKDIDFHVYVIQKKELKESQLIKKYCQRLNMAYHPIIIGDNIFQDAPVTDRWPESIYYRLLAHDYLPKDLDRILYLDADILVINPLTDLYNMKMDDHLYAAASHTTEMMNEINRFRLKNPKIESYYNTGVLLYSLDKIDKEVNSQDIFNFIRKNGRVLFLPDQDILNGLYGHKILQIPEEKYNYDTRFAIIYEGLGEDKYTIDKVMRNTSILHFCGKDKPWKPFIISRFVALYQHYQVLTERVIGEII